MEGKELYNEDEEFDPKSKKGIQEDEDADDFGLPEIEDSFDKDDAIGDPFTDSTQSGSSSGVFDDSMSNYSTNSQYSDPDYPYDQDQGGADSGDDNYRSSYYDDTYEQKKSPVGWVIFGVIFIIIVIVGGFMWYNWQGTEPEPEPKTIQEPVIEMKTPEPEPVVEEPEPEPVQQAGVYEINEPTGRYHVIVASSIDKDLVRDYGNKLAKEGMACKILAPRGNFKFHRLSVADFEALNDAAIKSEQLKNKLGADVWVIRY